MERKSRPPGSVPPPDDGKNQAFLPAPSPDEIARRQRVFAESFKLRDSIGTISLSTEELLGEEDEEDA